jgi:thiol:disulfide interchange protein
MNPMNKNLLTRSRAWQYAGACLVVFLLLSFASVKQVANVNDSVNPGRNSSGVYFSNVSWDTAIKTAAQLNKYVFVDAYASWCGTCRLLKRTTFRDKSVAEFFNRHFVNVSIDMESSQGKLLAEKWGIKAYPTLIVFDSHGQPVLEEVGFLKPRDLLSFAKTALERSE